MGARLKGPAAAAKALGLALVIVVVLVIIVLAAALALGRVKVMNRDTSSEVVDGPNAEGADATSDQEENGAWPFEGFPDKSYASFDEAEQVAGYHIPRPSAEFPAAFGVTHLRWFPQFETPLSTTQYTYPPLAPTSIAVIILPSYFYSTGDEGATRGDQTSIGPKRGWMKELNYSSSFTYRCGEIDGYNLWCTVSSPKQVPREVFERFVSTLE